jgi:hypothetical protein
MLIARKTIENKAVGDLPMEPTNRERPAFIDKVPNLYGYSPTAGV